MNLKKVKGLNGDVTIPGDKSISHRAVMLGSLAEGITVVHNFLQGADCLSTIDCFNKMGIICENNGQAVRIHGKGLHGLSAPTQTLDVGNSGTTTRLISGILSAQNFTSVLTGDVSIQTRPMDRIMIPLRQMGADIEGIKGNNCAPLRITGQKLHGIHYHSPVASAQVKSSILLAGLYADGETKVTEPHLSRNHTELMFESFGINITSEGNTATVRPADKLLAQEILIPGDISSAAYFIAAGLIVPNSCICIRNVGINPTRAGILDICTAMGADITMENVRADRGEPVADLIVKTSNLKSTTIEGAIIPRLIDEIPIIAVMACFASGKTIIKDAAELKVKESNRIDVMVENLTNMGADIVGTDDGLIINGGAALHGASVDSKLDHRIAMSFAVAALAADGETTIQGAECVNISYPAFYSDLTNLSK